MTFTSLSIYLFQPHWLKVDFDKWKDEDDSDIDEEKDMAFEDVRGRFCCKTLMLVSDVMRLAVAKAAMSQRDTPDQSSCLMMTHVSWYH